MSLWLRLCNHACIHAIMHRRHPPSTPSPTVHSPHQLFSLRLATDTNHSRMCTQTRQLYTGVPVGGLRADVLRAAAMRRAYR